MTTKRIGILGIGGIGGYLAGLLARAYDNDSSVEVVFIARGQTLENIKERGLIVKSMDDEFIAQPAVVSADPNEIGELDLLLHCVKTHSLKAALEPYVGCLKTDSVVITLQNSVEQSKILEPVVPPAVRHLPGCIYIISNIAEPGTIIRKKSPEKVFFGPTDGNTAGFQWILDLMTTAKIDANLVDNIEVVNWNKFMFISSVATATSYFDEPILQMLNTEAHRLFLLQLVDEVKAVALAQDLPVDEEIAEKVISVTSGLGEDAKSSLQLDIEKGLPSELEELTGSVINLGQQHQIATPGYQQAYEGILQRIR